MSKPADFTTASLLSDRTSITLGPQPEWRRSNVPPRTRGTHSTTSAGTAPVFGPDDGVQTEIPSIVTGAGLIYDLACLILRSRCMYDK